MPATVHSRPAPHCRWGALSLFAASLVILAGCASKPGDPGAPLPRKDLAEYRQVITDAIKATRATVQSLDQTVAQVPCPSRVHKAFTKDVHRLEVDSFKMRARAQAIRTRGAVYFEQWHEHLASVADPDARQQAEQRRELLQQRFDRIRLLSQQIREAFQPFMAGLRRLRNGLENNPAAASTEAMQKLIRTTRDQGQSVEKDLAAVLDELDAVAGILKPGKMTRKD